ncbi:MAG: DUF4838 domain-containing protein [Clostridia bacterium]|nr:DUF4838 domain-containing protein [Clostridia bacterium]
MNRIITENGKSRYHIVTNRMAHEGELYAAAVLYQYLFKATNAVVPYFSDCDRCPRVGPEIHIGAEVRGLRTDVSHLSEEGFIIRTRGEDLVIAGKTPRGTIYGVYYFLEQFIHFRCFTKDVETFDTVNTLTVGDLDLCRAPAFEYREVYFRSAFDADFCIKNRLNSNLAPIPQERGGKMKFFNFHHSFGNLVPPDTYYESHPEYFSLVEGERLRWRTQLCLSNEEVFQIARKTLRGWIKDHPECKVFSVAQNDWRNYCTCPTCKKLDDRYGTPAASVITFVNRLADDIREDYPHVLLHTFAYQYTKKAPLGLSVRENVIVRLCNIECSWDSPMEQQAAADPDSEAAGFIQNIREWSTLCKHLYIWDYACDFHNYLLPFPNYRSMPENMRLYRKNNIVGVMQQGNFSYGEAAGLADLECYLSARLLWDPEQDAGKLIDEFVDGVYGKEAAPYMRAYIDLLCDRLQGQRLGIRQYTDDPFFTDELIEEFDALFQKAFAAANDERNKKYLQKEYLSIRYMKISRMETEHPKREALIDQLYEDVKAAGIVEIRERRNLEATFQNLRQNRYAAGTDHGNLLYYIMK